MPTRPDTMTYSISAWPFWLKRVLDAFFIDSSFGICVWRVNQWRRDVAPMEERLIIKFGKETGIAPNGYGGLQ